jgi:hypothetical protein
MPQIQRTLYENLASRHLAVKGTGAMVDIDETVLGVLPLEQAGPTALYQLQGIHLQGRYWEANADVGEYPWTALWLEPDSDVIATILTFHVESSTDVNMYMAQNFTLTGSPYSFSDSGSGYSLDTRGGRGQVKCLNRSHSDSSLGQKIARIEGIDTPIDLQSTFPIVITPGSGVMWNVPSTGVGMNFSAAWTEQLAYRTEL